MIVANLSGGRDSSAMVVKWLEIGNKIDHIIFCDTGFEFDAMYFYLEKLEGYLYKEFGMLITYINSLNKIYDWAFEKPIARGENKGRLRGLPRAVGKDYCTRETKANPTKEFVLSHSPNKFKNTVLIGYTYDEVKNGRVSNLDYATAKYPLAEWKMNEPEVDEFLKKRGIANKLYEKFSRTGCYMCPKQSLQSLYTLYKYYPHFWEIMKNLEEKAKVLNCVNQTFKPNMTLENLEKRFKNTPNALFSDVYAEDETCFCLR
ncbi:hypothetical protein LS70_003745 [Helicobacter sp. MIT 11-5569]|uniref:phosphoadenosine phosphosulfate reductase domain-containing protein n=1 Tax=Helicobacter sp. MIT 11-5569 TaxID=1548151 RepID=UPI00068C1ECB|nr:phosphoadenosine phosphosulfate reductase family protein [Helicobacter sp. MIT 11-5569]TLD83931.1 hypothetical protein LS70_003745 [Helicobacter sp. MIT 11-5569]